MNIVLNTVVICKVRCERRKLWSRHWCCEATDRQTDRQWWCNECQLWSEHAL